MKLIAHQNAASSVITVTGTATALFSLIDTAGSVSNTQTFMLDPANGGPADYLSILPEDGDIRIGIDGITPTSSLGMYLSQGVRYNIPFLKLSNLKLIRVGGANVSCSIDLGRSHAGDVLSSNLQSASLSGTVTVDSEFPAAAALSDNFANPTTTNVASMNMVYDGSTWDRLKGDSTDGVVVNLGGPANPTIDSYTHAAINLTTGANQLLVSSAANKQIWVYGYAFTVGDADGQTVSLQDEDDTAVTGVMEFAQYGGVSVPPSGNFAMPVHKLATDKDLEIDITGGDVDGWIAYAIVSV